MVDNRREFCVVFIMIMKTIFYFQIYLFTFKPYEKEKELNCFLWQ